MSLSLATVPRVPLEEADMMEYILTTKTKIMTKFSRMIFLDLGSNNILDDFGVSFFFLFCEKLVTKKKLTNFSKEWEKEGKYQPSLLKINSSTVVSAENASTKSKCGCIYPSLKL